MRFAQICLARPCCRSAARRCRAKYWLAVCTAIFPDILRAGYEYIRFVCHAGEGSHEDREFLESSVCDHLSAAEREHLELLIWWDDHRDLRIKGLTPGRTGTYYRQKPKRLACERIFQESRHNALEWLRVL